MEVQEAVSLVRQMLMLMLTVSGPLLAVGLVVGLAASLLQGLTQIQEQSLSLIPKMVAVAAAVVLLLPWINHRMLVYAAQMFTF